MSEASDIVSIAEFARLVGVGREMVRLYGRRYGMPYYRRRGVPLAEGLRWVAEFRAQRRGGRPRTKPVPAPRKCLDCAEPAAKYNRRCEVCRDAAWARSHATPRKPRVARTVGIAEWAPMAQALYESGHSYAEVADRVGVSHFSVGACVRSRGWDRVAHQRNALSRAYPWRDRVQPLWEAGSPYDALREFTGLCESRLLDLAKLWGWDRAARWNAIWTRVRGGVTQLERRAARQKAAKFARRAMAEAPTIEAVQALRTTPTLCPYCGHPIEGAVSIDHIDPIARGGSNEPDNLIACCKTCNTGKHDVPLLLWLAQRAARKHAQGAA